MKKVLLPAILLTGWLILLSTDIPVGENFFPSAGRFFNPFQGIWQSVRSGEMSLEIKGDIRSSVKILFDERDVPHIYADNMEDALYAQGYLHAAHRLFSMDISTRAAAGRLSEILGSRTIAYDHNQRQRGFEKAAIEKAKSWYTYEGNASLIDAYVQGVNDFIQTLDYTTLPIEYKILSARPVPWSATHTALMATNMAIMLCLQEHDLDYSTARQLLSPEEFSFLFPLHNAKESPVIPADHEWTFEPSIPENKIQWDSVSRNQNPADKKVDLHGSNNWAVAASKTRNGLPILANDPHLALTLPNIWYEMEIHTPDVHVHGVSIPGLPFIVIGFNESIAWGTTNSGQDVLDWYTIQWQDSSRIHYYMDGKATEAILRPEVIGIRGKRSITDTIRYTHWGPVMSQGDHKDMAMKWIGHIQANTNDMAFLQKINKASNVSDYRDAVKAFQYPAQNKVFASTTGDIAISVAGVMPIRPVSLGREVLDGSKSTNDWTGLIPFEHAPFIINPESGFVSSANQAPAGITYPYDLIGERTFEDYRGRVINSILDTMSDITVQDMMSLQQNNFNLHAAEILPHMLSIVMHQECMKKEYTDYIQTLQHWTYEQHKDSLAPVLFEMWYDAFEHLFFDELDSLHVMHPEDWRIAEMLIDSNHRFFDVIATENVRETAGDIICQSFETMMETFLALDIDERNNWGSYKATTIPHLGRFDPFGVKFLSTSGGRHIVNAQSRTHGPSWRMIVELSTPPKAFVNYPGGQSGNPASKHYADFIPKFYEGKYFEVALRPDPASWQPLRQINIHPE
jgi:penicillin amidase